VNDRPYVASSFFSVAIAQVFGSALNGRSTDPEDVASVTVERQPLWTNRKHEHGPFDIIGDVHGCYDELVKLLAQLGYQGDFSSFDSQSSIPTSQSLISHPDGRKVVFLGDLVDRGPKIPHVLRLVMNMVASGTALCVPGNHDDKLLRKLKGRNVQISQLLLASAFAYGSQACSLSSSCQ
jgi:protein phosphatase